MGSVLSRPAHTVCELTSPVAGYSNSFGVFQTYYADHQLASYSYGPFCGASFVLATNLVANRSSDISWIGSFQLAMVLACAFFAGKAFDAGYIKYLLCAALLFYAAGSALSARRESHLPSLLFTPLQVIRTRERDSILADLPIARRRVRSRRRHRVPARRIIRLALVQTAAGDGAWVPRDGELDRWDRLPDHAEPHVRERRVPVDCPRR